MEKLIDVVNEAIKIKKICEKDNDFDSMKRINEIVGILYKPHFENNSYWKNTTNEILGSLILATFIDKGSF